MHSFLALAHSLPAFPCSLYVGQAGPTTKSMKGGETMNEITTTDLSDFGYIERVKARKLLEAWETQGLPEDFENDKVTIMFNRNSGYVFLTNSEYEVAMLCGDTLESFYNCPNCGNEGFDGDEYEFKKNEGYCSPECLATNN